MNFFYTAHSQEDPTDFTPDPVFFPPATPVGLSRSSSQDFVLSSKGITQFTPVQGEAFDPFSDQ
jgi:hypothetical protein